MTAEGELACEGNWRVKWNWRHFPNSIGALLTLTGSVSLITALPSLLCVVMRTWLPGFDEIWFSVGGRLSEEAMLMVNINAI